MRGTFGNIHLGNQLRPGAEGGVTVHFPDGEETTIYEASIRYQEESVPLLVLAGKEYGTGAELTVMATDDGGEKEFQARARVDSPVEVEYLRNGGIL